MLFRDTAFDILNIKDGQVGEKKDKIRPAPGEKSALRTQQKFVAKIDQLGKAEPIAAFSHEPLF